MRPNIIVFVALVFLSYPMVGFANEAGRELQNALADAGYDPGPVDGQPGANTWSALTSWFGDTNVGKEAPNFDANDAGYWALLVRGFDPQAEVERGKKLCASMLSDRGRPDLIWVGEWTYSGGGKWNTSFFVFGNDLVVANSSCSKAVFLGPNNAMVEHEHYIEFTDSSPDGKDVYRAILLPVSE